MRRKKDFLIIILIVSIAVVGFLYYQKRNEAGSLESEVGSLQELLEEKREEIDDLEQETEEIDSLNKTIAQLEEKISDLSENVGRPTVFVETLDNGDVENNFVEGYEGDFEVKIQIGNIDHNDIIRADVNVYILTGGRLVDTEQYQDFRTLLPQKSSIEKKISFDISEYESKRYTVIVTTTDLLAGVSSSSTSSFNVLES